MRDREVRNHGAAHLAAAGSLVIGGASYSYHRGPDGVQYAVSSEVNPNTPTVMGEPAATRIRLSVFEPQRLLQPSLPHKIYVSQRI